MTYLNHEQRSVIERVMRMLMTQNGVSYYFGDEGVGHHELAEDTAYLLSVPDEDGKSLYAVQMPADLYSNGATHQEVYELARTLLTECIGVSSADVEEEEDTEDLTPLEVMLVGELILLVREQLSDPALEMGTLHYRDGRYPGLEALIDVRVVHVEEAAS